MKQLLEGLERYERTAKARYSKQFATLALGQQPKTFFVTCADSRVDPNLIASADPGELFVVRNIANLVPRADADDPSVGAATSYAVNVLGVEDIVICGHSGCGGAKALLTGGVEDPFLAKWLTHGQSGADAWREHGALDPARPEHDQLSQTCTLMQLKNLLTYSFVRERVEKGDLRLHAFWFDIAEGIALAYSTTESRYVPAVAELTRVAAKSMVPPPRDARVVA